MIESAIPAVTPGPRNRSRIIRIIIIGALGFILLAVLGTGFFLWTRAPLNLGTPSAQASAQLLKHWQAGEVVALVRHAERCDRSNNPCLGPTDGITRLGSESSVIVGQGFIHMGMGQTDVFASPMTRTTQTARYMFGEEAISQDWLASCGSILSKNIVSNKVAHRNAVLVTHSGCIKAFEKQNGFRHAPASKYNSSLFVTVDADGKLKVLGIMESGDWQSLEIKTAQK